MEFYCIRNGIFREDECTKGKCGLYNKRKKRCIALIWADNLIAKAEMAKAESVGLQGTK